MGKKDISVEKMKTDEAHEIKDEGRSFYFPPLELVHRVHENRLYDWLTNWPTIRQVAIDSLSHVKIEKKNMKKQGQEG